MTDTIKPPLPEPSYGRLSDLQSGIDYFYTADQMRAYGQACADAAVAQERSRCLEICERHYSIEFIAQEVAAEIRALREPK